jgi:cytoskeletal protein RodZ
VPATPETPIEAPVAAAAGVEAGKEDGSGNTEPGDSEKPGKELPPEAETPQYWEQTFEALKKQSKPPENTRKKIITVAIVSVVLLALLLLTAIVMFNAVKKKQTKGGQTSESMPARNSSSSGIEGSQPSQIVPSGSTGKLSVEKVNDTTPTKAKKQIEIIGSGFEPGITVALASGAVTIPGKDVVVYGTTSVDCSVDISTVPAGSYDLILRNPSGETVTVSVALRISP